MVICSTGKLSSYKANVSFADYDIVLRVSRLLFSFYHYDVSLRPGMFTAMVTRLL